MNDGGGRVVPSSGFNRQPRLHRQLLQVLIGNVTSEAIAVGSLLPREADLATQYGVSRGTAREAIRGLEERGLVSVKHGHGAIVNDPSEWDVLDADVLSGLITGRAGVSVIRDVLECRRILEVEAAGLAAERAETDAIAGVQRALEQMVTLAPEPAPPMGLQDPFHEADLAFHEAVMVAADNRALYRLTEPVQRAFLIQRQPLSHPEARVTRAVPEHRAVYDAIAVRDAKGAREAMRQVIATVEVYLTQYAEARAASEARGDQVY
jgi:DNA-binding FadR family transcriptional regulator